MDEAVRARSSAKGWLTRAERKLRSILNEETVSETEIDILLEQFTEKLKIYDSAQNRVESLLKEEDLEMEISNAADYRDELLSTFVKAKELKRNSVCDRNDGHSKPQRPCQPARLPNIDLPTYSGDVTKWTSFYDQFKAIVDNAEMPNISKFTYLRSVLKGEALRSIEGLSLTSDNYKSALHILQQRFGRSESIVFGHIQKLLSLSNSSDKNNLWSIYDLIQTHVRSLENLGIGGEQYGVILTPIVLHQLPNNIRLEWAREGEGHEGDLDFLLQFLFNEIRRRERSQTFGNSSVPTTTTDTRKVKGTATALFAGQSNGKKCVICDKGHFTDKCFELKGLSIEQRKDIVKKKGLCFICLGRHLQKNCTKQCFSCKGRHHMIFCDKFMNKDERPVALDEHDTLHVGIAYVNSMSKRTLMQVVKTKIFGKTVNVMFDSGADRSFITSNCVSNLGLKKIGKEKVIISCFANNKPNKQEEQKKVYRLEAFGKSLDLLEIPTICCDLFRCAVPYPVLKEFEDIKFGEDFWADNLIEIDILIGLDLYWDLIGNETVRSRGLVAQRTTFGWMLSGQYLSDEGIVETKTKKIHSLLCHCEIKEEDIRRFWDLECVGIVDPSVDDNNTNKILIDFNTSVVFDKDRYQVRLPWKNDSLKNNLMDNKEEALKRLTNLEKKLNKDPVLKTEYNAVLTDLETSGIIHEVPETEIDADGPVFYLPHRPVVREQSLTTKIRPVFDASAKGKNGISLNDCMETGPNLIPDIIKVLLRFRRWKFGLSADISKAFLQIKLDNRDQDVHRFLWNVNDQIRTMRFERVTFGNACSPFLLNATLKHHLTFFDKTRTVLELDENLYVDDWLSGGNSEEEIEHMMTEADQIMRKGGFTLAKWGSNLATLPQSFMKKFDNNLTEPMQSVKILGVSWNMMEDCFCFETLPNDLYEKSLITKRKVLSIIARIFDPLGLLTPYTITLKIIFQEVWRLGLDWDESLPLEIMKEVSRWIDGLEQIKNWTIPRRLTVMLWPCDEGIVELICFSDASEKAYGCCIYIKTTEKTGKTTVRLVLSRVRVAPLKRVTLPRLELLAAFLSARLFTFARDALGLTKDCSYRCYTDSRITLSWIQNDPSKWKPFVSNRVRDIQENTNPEAWGHCPGKDNPADLLTRGITAKEFRDSDLWLHGPSWLSDDHDQQLSEFEVKHDEETVHKEILEESKCGTILTSLTTKMSPLMDYDKFSDFAKIVRIVSWVKRFVKNCKLTDKTVDKDLTPDELEEGRITVLRCAQREHYEDEVTDLLSNRRIKRSSSIFKLSPFIGQHDLLRVRGRLDFAPNLLYDEKYPIILPKCHLSYLIVKLQHSLMKHAGVGSLISTLRNNYWIISVRTIAKGICKRCIHCQRQDSRPCEQVTAPLPEDRIKRSPPFSIIGVDHAGPLWCRDFPDKKRYILLFTCAITRAIHIELVDSLSLEDFILAFRRFCARRGRPSTVYSDNAKTFKGAYKILQQEMGHTYIMWKFSAPLSPWWGGWWERLIRSIKSALKKSLGQNLITRNELETVLHEIEACVNSRPLTYVEETGIPLSPSHFLIGRSSPMNPVEVGEFCMEMTDLRLREKCQTMILDEFWKSWEESYIRNLPPFKVQKENTDIKVGTVVLIQDDNKPRLRWPLGIISKTFPGKDGFIRAVELKTSKGFITRAIQKLHKLELYDVNSKEMDVMSPPIVNTDSEFFAEDNDNSNEQAKVPVFTRSGRKVKTNVKFDI